MNKHYMNLDNKPFVLIKQEIKTIEMRLNDEKRKQIKKGDVIEFTNNDNNDTILCLVEELFKFDNFKELYDSFDIHDLGYEDLDINNASYLDMNQYYGDNDIKQYGVLGIKIKLITKPYTDLDEYQSFTKTTCNHELDKDQTLITGVMGLTGEAGEVIDIVKKWYAQGHDLDINKIKDELGDVCWYISCICNALGITIDEVLKINMDKLKKRYPNGFNKQDSINRK